MRCPACQGENRADRRFCADCAAVRFSACQFVNQPGERFCGGCGAALGPPAVAPSPLPASAPPADGERR